MVLLYVPLHGMMVQTESNIRNGSASFTCYPQDLAQREKKDLNEEDSHECGATQNIEFTFQPHGHE